MTPYDKLILASGVTPAALPVPNADLENIFFMRGRAWAIKIKDKLSDDKVKNVVVIGSGYIGVEAAEVFAKAGKNVTIIDMIDHVLGNYLDQEMTDILAPVFKEIGVNLELGEQVLSTYDITAHINTLALVIKTGLTLEDLAEADFFFQPGFDRQWSLLNLAAQSVLGETKF